MKVLDLTSDSLLTVFDNETLLMAMGLMSTLLTDDNQVSLLYQLPYQLPAITVRGPFSKISATSL